MYRQEHRIRNLFICLGTAFFMLSFLLLFMKSNRRLVDLPFMSWPENILFNVDDTIWIFLFMGFIFFLLKGDTFFTFAFSFLATLCRYESIPCILILMALYYYFFRENRPFLKKVLKFYIVMLILFCSYTLILCVLQKDGIKYFLELLYDKIFIRFDFARRFMHKNFNFITTEDKIWGYFSWPNTRMFIKTSLLSTYFFIILFLVPSGDRITSLLSTFGIIFFISVALQSYKLITYVFLLIPLSAISIRRFIYPPLNIKLLNTLSYMVIWFMCIYLISVY